MNLYFDLFWTFAKIGVCTFGGGYAMLPILQRELVEKRHWASEEELSDYFAIGQCTPGIIAVNTATFVGHKLKGAAGGVAANKRIRAALEAACRENGLKLYLPPLRLCGDNGAMIGSQAYYEYLAGNVADLSLNAYANLDIEKG